MRKRYLNAILITVFAAAALFGCGKSASEKDDFKPGTDMITVDKSGVTLEEYSEETGLVASEVEKFVKKELSSVAGAEVSECSSSDGKLYLKTLYDTASCYTKYTGYPLFYGEVLDGRLAGLSFDAPVYEVKSGRVSALTYKISDADYFAAVSQEITVNVPGDVIAVSDPDAVVKKNKAFVHSPDRDELVYIIYKK